jgi:oligosaccharide repeat unit polymerase
MPSLLLLVVSLWTATVATTRDRRSPLAWSLWIWVAVAALHVVRPLPLVPISVMGAAVASVGLVAITLPVMRRRQSVSELSPAAQGHRGVALVRFIVLGAAVLAMVVVGAMAFRSGIALAAGTDFGSLDLRQIRHVQNTAGRGGGFAALLSAANPILGCLGVYGAMRYNRAYILLLVIAIIAAAQSPARTSSISLIVIVVVFWLYARNAISRDEMSPTPRRLPIGRLILAGVVAVAFFLIVGDMLQKNYVAGMYETSLPGWAVDPVLYFSGGLSALTVAVDEGVKPIEFGSSIYLLMRVASIFAPGLHVPDTIGRYAEIPMPFNVYTGFGQIYFDFGLLGVFVLSLILGNIALRAHRLAESGAMEWAWVSAVTASLLFSLPQGFRLFNLDVTLELALGFFIFWSIRRAKKTTALTHSAPELTSAERY